MCICMHANEDEEKHFSFLLFCCYCLFILMTTYLLCVDQNMVSLNPGAGGNARLAWQIT